MKKIKALVNYIIFLIKKGARAYFRYGFKEMIMRARRYRGRILQYAYVSNLSDDMQQERRRLDQFIRDHEGKKKIVFFSTNESWGGSEVGCAHMARGFAKEGWAVMLCMVRYVQIPKMLKTIQEEGEAFLLERTSTGGPDGTMNIISTFNPDIVIISQGHLFEGLRCMQWFESQNIAYANFIPLAEKTHTQFLPHTGIIQEHTRLLNQSKIIFLDNYRAKDTIQEIHGVINVPFHVVYNYDVDFDQPITWDEPTPEKPFRLAVLGRLDSAHKGLDMLFSAVATDKWRQRPLQIILYGSGLDEDILRKKIKQDNLVNIIMAGPTDNQAQVLLNSHGLVFASRMEGTPLALIEAMLCHRMAIVTPVGGMPEIIQDGKNGFLASGATKEAINEVLERAWNQRYLWQTMGLDAGVSIRNKVQKFPFQSCSDILKNMVN
jgi:glycosyltransferase involved in cell wall biosynthesis